MKGIMEKRSGRLWLGAVLVLALLLGLGLASSPIDPAAYRPPPAPPLTGVLAADDSLARTRLVARGKIHGGEDVAVDEAGRLYAGTAGGTIVRVTLGAGGEETVETFAVTGGRPLGLAFDAGGGLLVADAVRGLLAVDAAGRVVALSREAGGVPFGFADDLDVAADGRVYFSDASSRFGHREYLYDLLEARPHGRLLVYDPAAGTTEVLRDGLYFANGVALSQGQDFVVVNETYRYRLQRCWLAGPKRGRCEIFADNLPGFPDGVASDRQGTFWVALFTVRNPIVDRLHPHPWAKRLLAALPRALWPRPAPYGLVLALDEEGRIVRSLHDPSGRVRGITSVEPHGGKLYFGNLDGDWLGIWQEAPATGSEG